MKNSLPSVVDLKTLMENVKNELLDLWKLELTSRLLNFDFEGTIELRHINAIGKKISRLPNAYLRHNISLLTDELLSLGYDAALYLDSEVDDNTDHNWGLHYVIQL